MRNKLFSVCLLFCCFNSFGQEFYKHFEVVKSEGLEKLSLKVSSKEGESYLNSVKSENPLEIYGIVANDLALSTFSIHGNSNHKYVKANLTCRDDAKINFTEALVNSLFTEDTEQKEIWQLKLAENISFDLDLNYLMGSANIDLSRLAVERLNITSGSADIFVNYSDPTINSVRMDTFSVKVNLGDITIENLNLTNAKEVIAEVGFGSIFLNCGEDWKNISKVNATVGAGRMIIQLPPSEVPVLIRIKNSALCHIKMPRRYEKISENVYSNNSFAENSNDVLELTVDVGMGSISFLQ